MSEREIWILIVVSTALTYLTRVLGYLVVRQFQTIPPRVAAALDAVPAAMLITIVVPVMVDGGTAERVVIAICAILSFRLTILPTVIIGGLLIVALRALGV